MSSISRDEFEAGWTQSLDSSAQPDALSLSLPCSSFQHTARSQAGREERPETSNKKRQRDAEGAEPVKASPHAVKSANGRQADNAAKRGDVIQIEEADSPEKPKSPAASRAAKRTRGGGASAPAPAPAVLPAASPATGARAHGSEAADTRDRAGIAGPSKSPHTASPATTRRQRDAEKLNDKAGKEGKESAEGKQGKEASIPSSRSAPATRAPAGSPAKPAGDRQVPETRVRKILNAEPAGQAGAHAKSSEASEEGDARGSSAARARPACRRFQMQDEADPEGWVTIVSDGPAPRLSMPAAAAAQMRAGGAASAGAGAVVNFKRFFKKVRLAFLQRCAVAACDMHGRGVLPEHAQSLRPKRQRSPLTWQRASCDTLARPVKWCRRYPEQARGSASHRLRRVAEARCGQRSERGGCWRCRTRCWWWPGGRGGEEEGCWRRQSLGFKALVGQR